MTRNGKYGRRAGAVLGASLIASTALGQDRDTQLNAVQLGDQESSIIALLGQPTGYSEALTLGVPNAELRWTIGPGVYVAWFIANRLVSFRICQSITHC